MNKADETDEIYMKCMVCCKELPQWSSFEGDGPDACAGCILEMAPIPWGEWAI